MVRSRLQPEAPDDRIHVCVVIEPEGERAYALEAAMYSIGRDQTNSIVLNDEAVSRQHAIFMRVPTEKGFSYRLMDGNKMGEPSTNGVQVNGQRCVAHDLKDGDELLFAGSVKAVYYHRSMQDNNIQKLSLKSIPSQPIDQESTTYRGLD